MSRDLFVHQASEDFLAGAAIAESVLGDSLPHGLEQLLHEHAFQLLRRGAQPFVGRRRSGGCARSGSWNARHRLTTSAEIEPARRSASKIKATCDGGVCTACKAVISCCTDVP